MRFDDSFVREALGDVAILGDLEIEDANFSVDSRSINNGEIFVAIAGVKSDGHSFLAQALSKGAAGFIIARSQKNRLDELDAKELAKKFVLLVADPLQALIKLAICWRSKFDYPVIGITGSVGKTSTKEMLGTILNLNGNNFLVSQANQNTKIGLSLNILKMRSNHQGAIFELGINKRGEMAELSKILRPTTAIITTIGHCHMEGLGSLADIALEKRDIFKYFNEKSIGIVNGDVALLANVSYPHPVIKFGCKTTNQIQARKIRIGDQSVSFILKIYKEKFAVTMPKPHMGVIFNALGATAACVLLGVPNKVIIEGIQLPQQVPGRFEQKKFATHKGILINDCYNANPESMKAALLAFENIKTDANKIAVLGDMLELGVNSPFWHRQLGRFLRKVSSVKEVILVGDFVKWTKKTAPVGVNVEIVANWQDAAQKLEGKLHAESVVLVKGSNGVGLRNLVDAFTL